MKKSIIQIAQTDGRYSPRAFEFVHDGLNYTVQKVYKDSNTNQPSHISGKQLCLGLAEMATTKWGRLAKVVLNSLGVKSTMDFGQIVYLLVENQWLYARAEDTIEQFKDVYDFTQIFEESFKFSGL